MEDENNSFLSTLLDRIIKFHSTCDSKTAIIIATIGLFINISFSAELLAADKMMIQSLFIDQHLETYIIFILISISILGLVIGLVFLCLSLIARPTVKCASTSSHFLAFGEISEYEKNDLIRILEFSDTSRLHDEFADQIIINSKIAQKKFNYFNKGLIVSMISNGCLLIFQTINYLRF